MAFVRPDVVLLDAMAFDRALSSLAQLRRRAPEARVLLRAKPLDARSVLAAVRDGAWGAVCVDDAAHVVARAVRCVSHGDVWFGRGDLVAALKMRRLIRAPVAPITFGSGDPRLTQREDQVLDLIGSGLSNKEIARLLEISDKTVKTHLHRVYVKLNQSGRYKALLAQVGQQPHDLSWATLDAQPHPAAAVRILGSERPAAGEVEGRPGRVRRP